MQQSLVPTPRVTPKWESGERAQGHRTLQPQHQCPSGGKTHKKKSSRAQWGPEDGVEVGLPAPNSSLKSPALAKSQARLLDNCLLFTWGAMVSPNQPLTYFLSISGTCLTSIQDHPPPSKAPSRTQRAWRGLPKQTTAQQTEGTSLQDQKVPPVTEKGKRRGRRANSGGPS